MCPVDSVSTFDLASFPGTREGEEKEPPPPSCLGTRLHLTRPSHPILARWVREKETGALGARQGIPGSNQCSKLSGTVWTSATNIIYSDQSSKKFWSPKIDSEVISEHKNFSWGGGGREGYGCSHVPPLGPISSVFNHLCIIATKFQNTQNAVQLLLFFVATTSCSSAAFGEANILRTGQLDVTDSRKFGRVHERFYLWQVRGGWWGQYWSLLDEGLKCNPRNGSHIMLLCVTTPMPTTLCKASVTRLALYSISFNVLVCFFTCKLFLRCKDWVDEMNTYSSGTTITHLRCGWFGCIRCTESI